MPAPLSRRRLLGLGGALALSVASGCSGSGSGLGGRENATCVPRASLDSHRSLSGLSLIYAVDGQRTAFRFDGAFFARLESWADGLDKALPSRPKELWTYGSWTSIPPVGDDASPHIHA